MWGNHDAEGGASKRRLSQVLSAADSPYLLYADGYTEGGSENRCGNFSITVLDPTGQRPVGALILLDSGMYDYQADVYQQITPGQVDWYRQEIDRLQALYAADGSVIPTIAFAHMPLPDFSVACYKAATGNGAEFVIEGGRGWGGDGNQRSALFDAMVEKGSTKAYFVGHYHSTRYQVRMDGVLLGFCPQAGFSHPGQDSPRSVYIYTVTEDFSITTHNCPEPLS